MAGNAALPPLLVNRTCRGTPLPSAASSTTGTPPWPMLDDPLVDKTAFDPHDAGMSVPEDPLDPPCPCASGRRLRQCCALSAGPDETEADTEPVLKRLLAFGGRPEFAAAQRRLNRSLLADLTAKEGEVLVRDREQELETAILFLLHTDLPGHRGDSLGLTLLRREGAAMPVRQRSALANMVAHPTSLYEIVDVFPGKGLELRDLLRRFTVRVRERSASRMVEPGWLFLTKVRRQPDGTPVIDMPMLHFDDRLRPAVDAWLLRRWPAGDGASIEPRGVLAELFRIWQQAMASALIQPPPALRLQNQHGDPLELCEAELQCDEERLRAWLEQAPDWEPDAEGEENMDEDDEAAGPNRWGWFEPMPGEQRRSLGQLEIAGDRCLLNVNSRARFERAVALLCEGAGAVVLDVKWTTAAELMAKAGKARRRHPKAAKIPPEVEAQVLHQAMDAHYRGWIDEPLPMFGGRTPRAMAKVDPAAVARAIWQISNGPPGVRYDADWMYDELGVKPLGHGEFSPGVSAE